MNSRVVLAGVLLSLAATSAEAQAIATHRIPAALARRGGFKKGDRVGLILCGSNVAFGDVLEWKGRFGL